MIEVKEHLPERDSEQVQKIKCINTIVVYKTVEKKSKLSDIVWDLHLVKDVVIAVLICAVLSNNKWIATGNVNKIAAIITIGAIIIYGLFAFDVWLRCRK